MVAEFISRYAKLIASYPEQIRVEQREQDENYSEIMIYASNVDAGKLIGKEGKMIGSIKTLISGCKAKDGGAYKVIVKTLDE